MARGKRQGPLGTVVVATAGAITARRRKRQEQSPASARPDHGTTVWTLALLSTALIAPIALHFAFHDEVFLTGHISIASEIQNGVYPPRHVTFPQFELRYHDGLDLLTATVGAIFRCPIDRAIDATTIVGWFATFGLLARLADRLLPTGRGALTATLTLLGGGFAPLLLVRASPIARALSFGKIGDAPVNRR